MSNYPAGSDAALAPWNQVEEDGYAECAHCGVQFTEDHDLREHDVTVTVEHGHKVLPEWQRRKVCHVCLSTCTLCGEYLDDETAELGPGVSVRQYESDGRRGEFHAQCAAEWLLTVWRGRGYRDHVDLDEITKDEITDIATASFTGREAV